MKSQVVFIAVLLVLSGCGKSGLSGDYLANNKGHPPGPFGKLSFHNDGTVDAVSVNTYAAKYSVDGSKVRIEFTDGQVSIYTDDGKGCLTNEVGNTYCKKAS